MLLLRSKSAFEPGSVTSIRTYPEHPVDSHYPFICLAKTITEVPVGKELGSMPYASFEMWTSGDRRGCAPNQNDVRAGPKTLSRGE